MKKIYLFALGFLCLAAQPAFSQVFTSVDILQGPTNSNPSGMIEFNGKVYFAAEGDTLAGTELWSSDGTAGGTQLVKDIWPGPGSSLPDHFTVVGSKMFFSANDSVHGLELWVTDGTTSGTMLVSDINSGTSSSGLSFPTSFGGKLYFVADDGTHGLELWVSDGTQGGTSMLKDINPGAGTSDPFGIVTTYTGFYFRYTFNVWNGKFYFRADDGVHGSELWVSDGTTLGTTMLSDIWPGPGSSNAYWMTPCTATTMVFGARDSLHGYELWTTDGTAGGTSLLKDIYPGIAGSSPGGNSGFAIFNGKVYFAAQTAAAGIELWSTDGTSIGTTMVSDILPGPGSSLPGYEYGYEPFNGRLYFSATDSVNGQQLWSTDGTQSGTTLTKVVSSSTPYDAYPRDMIVFQGKMYFVASPDGSSGAQLYVTDGTGSGTHPIAPAIAPNADPMFYGGDFCVHGNSLFMVANFNSIGNELWIYTVPLGITEATSDHTISAYPNPFSTSITLSGLSSSDSYSVHLLDLMGRVCYSTTLDHPIQGAIITLPDLSMGSYILSVSGPSSSQTFKLVKN